jgi:acetate kinase
MNILVFNCGSSSLKYRLLDACSERELLGGEAQRIGPPTAEPARIVHNDGQRDFVYTKPMRDHAEAFGEVMKIVQQSGVVIDAVAHRVAHGGDLYRQPTCIDGPFLENLDALSDVAPLHNPPAVALMRTCKELFGELPQVAVFDTAYHLSIPEHAYTYPLPLELRQGQGIRKYGFHGTSHEYVAAEAARFLGRDVGQFDAVSCHLGSGGASLCAIRGGRSIDNTFGYSPLQGLIMSTRCGDIDPAIAMHLLARANGNSEQVDRMLNRRSGVLGLSGVSGDIRDILRRQQPGNGSEQLGRAAGVYLWRLRKYLGAYLSVVGRAQAIIFTDTIGEEVPRVREALCVGMEVFGLRIDKRANRELRGVPADVAHDSSTIRILVVHTNEERAIARTAYRRLQQPPAAA